MLSVELIMDTVCRKCGDRGYSELLIYCIGCEVAAEHRYCLNEFPRIGNEEVIWSCEECRQKVCKSASFNKLSLDGCRRMKRKKRIKNCSCIEAKANDSSVRYPSFVSMEDACKSAGLTCDRSLSDVQKKCLSSCNEKGEEDWEIKRRRQRLILEDADDSDRESESVEPGRKSIDKETTDWRATQTKGLCSPDSSAVPLASSGSPNQSPKKLQATFSGASECWEIVPVPETCNALLNSESHLPCDANACCVPAQPIIDPVWRGCFSIDNHTYGMVAHLSNKACSKVKDEGVKMLSQVLSVEMLPRADVWPKSFQRSAPTDDNIGLYFFPGSERDEMMFNQLLHEMHDRDLSLKVIFDEAELLIFSSLLLPQQHSRFHRRCYMWGTFRSVSHPERPVGERRSPKWQKSPISSDDPDDELALFPLEGEDMAFVARIGRRAGISLELGLGQPVGKDGNTSLGCKPRNVSALDSSLSLGKAVIALNSVPFMLDRNFETS